MHTRRANLQLAYGVARRLELALQQDELEHAEKILQLGRSKSYTELTKTSERVAQTFDVSMEIETEALESTIERLATACTVTELSKDIIKLAQVLQPIYGLGPHDALVFASIQSALEHLG